MRFGGLDLLVGGSAIVATAWISQRTLNKRELLGAEIRTRETLYDEFIRACSKLVVDSFERALDKPETLLPVSDERKTQFRCGVFTQDVLRHLAHKKRRNE